MRGVIRYKSYSFINKDPIIDRMRTAWREAQAQDAALRKGGWAELHRRSGLSMQTPHNWFDGDTRRPQFASVAAFTRSIGYDLAIVRVEAGRVTQFMQVKGGRRFIVQRRNGRNGGNGHG